MSVCQDQQHVACAAEEQPADLGAESADEEVAAQSEDAHGSLVGNPDMARVQMEAWGAAFNQSNWEEELLPALSNQQRAASAKSFLLSSSQFYKLKRKSKFYQDQHSYIMMAWHQVDTKCQIKFSDCNCIALCSLLYFTN